MGMGMTGNLREKRSAYPEVLNKIFSEITGALDMALDKEKDATPVKS